MHGTVALTTKIPLDAVSDLTQLLNRLKEVHTDDTKRAMSSPNTRPEVYAKLHDRRRRLTEGSVVRALLALGLAQYKDKKDLQPLLDLMAKDTVVRGHPGADKVASRGVK
jgi:hypothetical protein